MTDEEKKTKLIFLKMIRELKGEGDKGYLTGLLGRVSALAIWLKAKSNEGESAEFREFCQGWEKVLARVIDDLFEFYYFDEDRKESKQ